MRVFLVYPGHQMATVDVARGLHNGFLAQGCAVEAFELGQRAGWYQHLLATGEPRVPAEVRGTAALQLASDEVPARALRFEPDVIVVVHGGLLDLRAWAALAALRDRFPLHLVLTECPYQDEGQQVLARHASVVWANDRSSAERHGWRYLAAAYDPAAHHPPEEPIGGCPDVLFVGSGWAERVSFFGAIDWTGIHLRLVGPSAAWQHAVGTPLERHLDYSNIPGPGLWPYYAGSGAVVNLHRRSVGLPGDSLVEDAYSLNPRAYQVPACGGLLLSDWRPEWDEIFGSCGLPTFASPGELEKLVRYYLAEHAAREDAVMGSMEAVRPHTYTARAAQILEEVPQ